MIFLNIKVYQHFPLIIKNDKDFESLRFFSISRIRSFSSIPQLYFNSLVAKWWKAFFASLEVVFESRGQFHQPYGAKYKWAVIFCHQQSFFCVVQFHQQITPNFIPLQTTGKYTQLLRCMPCTVRQQVWCKPTGAKADSRTLIKLTQGSEMIRLDKHKFLKCKKKS